MQELISRNEREALYEAFKDTKVYRRRGDFICHVLEDLGKWDAKELVMARLMVSYTLDAYMQKRGGPKEGMEFHLIRELWLNMLINEHSSHDMYLLARYRDYLINLRDRRFTTSCPTIVSGFAQWCINKFDADYYDWLIKERKSKKLWQRIRNQECCPELRKFIQQEILEVTNILIQEPK